MSFNDDTELELPTGGDEQMALLEQMMAQMQSERAGAEAGASAPVPAPAAAPAPAPAPAAAAAPDSSSWITLYPIYIDARRRYRKGARRVPCEKAVRCPQSIHMANAAKFLGLEVVHEPQHTHPQDWENPGRIKVRLYADGAPLDPALRTRRALCVRIGELLQVHVGGVPPAAPVRATGRASVRARARRAMRGVPAAFGAHSPAQAGGLLNMDLGKMMGGVEGMGPLGSMLGGLDDEEPAEEEPAARGPPALGRRQRKRVVRIVR